VQENSCGDVLYYTGTVASLEVVTENGSFQIQSNKHTRTKNTAASNFEGAC